MNDMEASETAEDSNFDARHEGRPKNPGNN